LTIIVLVFGQQGFFLPFEWMVGPFGTPGGLWPSPMGTKVGGCHDGGPGTGMGNAWLLLRKSSWSVYGMAIGKCFMAIYGHFGSISIHFHRVASCSQIYQMSMTPKSTVVFWQGGCSIKVV
jgi:hypothetical protein